MVNKRGQDGRPAARAGAAAALGELARAQLQDGKLADAEQTARRFVAAAPKSVEALVLLGDTQRQRGRPNDAVLTLRDALAIEPGNAVAHFLLGIALRDGKRSAEAEFALKDAVAANPGFAEAHLELGNLYSRERQIAAAEGAYRKALAARPTYAIAHFNLGNMLREADRLEPAAAAYREAVKHKPDYVEAWYNLGLTEKERSREQDAVAAYGEAIRLRPQFPEAYNNLGVALRALARFAEAEQALQQALAMKKFAMPYYNLAGIASDQARFTDAVAAYRQCIALDPGFVAAPLDLAGLLFRLGEFAEAETLYRQMLETHSKDRGVQTACLDGLARVSKEQDRLPDAAAYYERVLRLDPGHAEAMAGLCQVKSHMCDWRNRDEDFVKLMAITERQIAAGERTAIASFAALARPLSPAQHLAVGRSWANETKRQMTAWRQRLDFRFVPARRHDRIRIGYVSQDFRNQAMGHLTRTMFGLHDRSQFEVFGYSVRKDDGSIYRQTIEGSCEHFRDVHALPSAEAAKRIFADEIDIMVDLMGYTEGNRMAITALRPAPVVVGFLRFPGSSGADFVDYMLTDTVVTTIEDQQHYSEQLVFLPNCYQPNDWTQEIDEAPIARAEFGLPEDAFVFSCFNNHYKIEPFIFDLWMRILKQVPNGVLWLMRINEQVEANLKREAETRGVAAARIVCARKAAKGRHLARQRLADLFLDTRYYTSHTTGSDALWGGLPVLTCPGDTFASRVTASLLAAAGLPELIVPDFATYERTAVHLATHPADLKAIRDKWAAQRTTCALFDTRRFTRNLERAYRAIWDDHCAGRPPRPLAVTEG
jgi:predicted O-linked N-acetylglucosamine transferase (SPINDLY family)